MVNVIFYGKDGNKVEQGNFNNEGEARLRALALNWAYSVIAEF